MLIEGLTLYYKVVKVFNTDFKMWPFCAFSWGKFNLTNGDKKNFKVHMVWDKLSNHSAIYKPGWYGGSRKDRL